MVSQVHAFDPLLIFSGSVPAPAPAGGWSDDFSGCSDGNLQACAGWGSTFLIGDGEARSTNLTMVSNIATNPGTDGGWLGLLADYSPADADYEVEIYYKVTAETSISLGALLRGTVTVGTDNFTGYHVYVGTGTKWWVIRYSSGSPTTIVDGLTITDVDWTTTYKSFRVTIAATGTPGVLITLYTNGTERASFEDTGGSIITQIGGAGFASTVSGAEDLLSNSFEIKD